MKKKVLIVLIFIALLIAGVSLVTFAGRCKSRTALTAYKSQLRAQGEKLTFEEAGYPFPLETNASLENFVSLSDRLSSISDIPAKLLYEPRPSTPGSAVVTWASTEPNSSVSESTNEGRPTWAELAKDCDTAAPALAAIRIELEHPPLRYGWNPTNPFSILPPGLHVRKRKTAQFLAADSLSALHENQLARAQTNLHVLTQLAQVHRRDFTLVTAMIRVAISGLALTTTWEALAADGWDENNLLALQHDWEGNDLAEALETGFAGERIFGEFNFKRVREADTSQQRGMMGSSGSPSIKSFSDMKDAIQGAVVMTYWHNHMDEDEMFYLRHMGAQVETARKLKANASGLALRAGIKERSLELKRMVESPLGKYRHLFSALALPNYQSSFELVVKYETQRRMTITVIALKRFYLQNARYPTALSEMAPQFVAAELVDPWNGKPFCYRLNADGMFTLYSVGEDGIDNGGDATSATSANAPLKVWSGKDVVWPTPVLPGQEGK